MVAKLVPYFLIHYGEILSVSSCVCVCVSQSVSRHLWVYSQPEYRTSTDEMFESHLLESYLFIRKGTFASLDVNRKKNWAIFDLNTVLRRIVKSMAYFSD